MLAGHLRSGAGMWQGEGSRFEERNRVMGQPSPEVTDKAPVQMPSSNFLADYSGTDLSAGFKANLDQGKVRVASSFQQGFQGRAVERYPSGETYVGEYVGGRRQGAGAFTDNDGYLMVSYFKAGRPVGEGVKLKSAASEDWESKQAVLVQQGKEDGSLTGQQAKAISKGIALGSGHKEFAHMGVSPPQATRTKPSYETETKAHFTNKGASPPVPKEDFLTRLASVEVKEADTKAQRMMLIPRVA